jgi:putative membrane protein
MVFFEVPAALQFSKSLFFIFFASYAILILVRGWKLNRLQTMWIIVPVGFLSLWIEAVGTATGWPFGEYTYGESIGWKILGVPITISFAWIAVVSIAVAFSNRRSRLVRAIEVGFWAMCFDLVLDPAAFAEQFWIWQHPDALYYGIPASNFIAWFAVAFVLSWFYPLRQTQFADAWRSVRLYQGVVLMFAALSVKAGMWLPFILGIIFILASEWRVRYDQSRTQTMV